MFAQAYLHRRPPPAWHYDPAGRLASIEHAGDDLFVFYQYAFDRANRLTGIDRTGFGPLGASDSALFGYDDRDQLISASHTYAAYLVDETYAYDPTGNRTESHLHGDDYETAADNRLESDGTYWYLFDNEGNVTEKRLGSDTGTLVARYTWDHRNRLTLVEIFDESTGDPLRTVGYAYDTFDRRIARWLDEGSDSSIQDRDFYYYDGADVALVLDENLEVEHRRLFGPAVDMILADETRDPSTGDLEDVYWALADHQGTVRDVATFDSGVTTHFEHVETDSYGRIVEVTHDIGGVAVVDSSNTPTLAYVFTGREWDPVVQLAYHINRWYDPGVGRWLSQDPLGFGGGDWNLYRYVGNSTIRYVDSTGLAVDLVEDSIHVIGGPNGKPGTWYHYYTPGGWFSSQEYAYSMFVEDEPDQGAIDSECKRIRNVQGGLSRIAHHGENASYAGMFVLGMAVPGPDDVVWGAVLSKYGIKLLWQKGKGWVDELTGRVLSKEEAEEILRWAAETASANRNCQRVTGEALEAMRREFNAMKNQAWMREAATNPSKYTPSQLEMMRKGQAPIGSDGFSMEIHHRHSLAEGGANSFDNFDFVTRTEHRLGENYKKHHPNLP